MMDDLPERLAARLARPLRGPQRFLLQPELSYGRHFGPPPANARPAAVLVLLYPREDGWHLPLTLRPDHLPDHAGQISLPGGLIEPGESSERAALRELQEELGVGPEGIVLVGRLSPLYLYNSNFAVAPWVAWIPECPVWTPNPSEVAELIEMPLEGLDLGNLQEREYLRHGLQFRAPHFRFGKHEIWGATCLVLGELAAVLASAD